MYLVYTGLTGCEKSSSSSLMSDNDPLPDGLSLQQWLDISEMTYSAFARLVPCATSYPRLIAQDRQRPSYELATRIEQVTHGAVPRTRWYPPGPKDDTPTEPMSIEDIMRDK